LPQPPEVELKVDVGIRAAYEEQYSPAIQHWRELAGKYKAKNIREVCAGMNFPRVLEVGAGEGAILLHLDAWPQKKELYAVEISNSGVSMILSRKLPSVVEAKHFDGYHVPYPDKFFDLSILSHVLEHVEYPRALLREMKRVAQHLAIEVPCEYARGADARIEHFLSYGHIDLYTPTLLRFLLRSEGFTILNERLTRATLDVQEYSYFENSHRPRTLPALAIRRFRYALASLRLRLAPSGVRDSLASACTVLCRPDSELKVFG
jgi:ubiquinone/menaquinone biosynthesis C-methylase UbiE